MEKYIYRVTCKVKKGRAEEWIKFFLEKHLDDLIDTGHFYAYSFNEIISEDSDVRTFSTDYFYKSPEDLDNYNASAASILKAETQQIFGDSFSCSRQLLEVIV